MIIYLKKYFIATIGGTIVKNVLLIKNPRAGRNSTRIETAEIVSAFDEYSIECLEKTTTHQGHAIEIAAELAGNYDAVVCCGGDGTYNEVANGILKSNADVPIIYLPCGSTNDFAHTLGISKDPKIAAKMYAEGLLNKYDVGLFNDRHFCYIASFGVATDISYNTSQDIKNLFGHSAYLINGFVLKLIPMLKNLKPAHMIVEYDGGIIEDDFYFGAVANTNEISGLFKLERENVKMNDGIFELLLVRGLNATNIGKVFMQARRQDYSGENITLLKTSKLKITTADDVPWTLDGEYGGAPKMIDISIKKEAVRVVSPKSKFID